MSKKQLYIVIILLALAFLVLKNYKYLPYRLEFLGHYDKIWAHRNNSILKANISEKYFNGIELDLEYNDTNNFLDVNHAPAKSINLHFNTYIKSLKKQPLLWLDIKNLKVENASKIAEKITAICSKYNYPISKLLIETQYPKALPIFTKLGFTTSYYLNYKIKTMDSIALIAETKKIKAILNEQPTIGISSKYVDYNFMATNFPNKKKYTWITDGIRARNFKLANRILNDTMVKVVLIQFKTFKGHR